jgi:hypothetical protein
LLLQHAQAARGHGAAGQQCFPHAVAHESHVRLPVEHGLNRAVVWHTGVGPVKLAITHAVTVQFVALQLQPPQRVGVHCDDTPTV